MSDYWPPDLLLACGHRRWLEQWLEVREGTAECFICKTWQPVTGLVPSNMEAPANAAAT